MFIEDVDRNTFRGLIQKRRMEPLNPKPYNSQGSQGLLRSGVQGQGRAYRLLQPLFEVGSKARVICRVKGI